MTEKLLKPGWKMVRFGDVVNLNTERVNDPLASGIERYVGLEHITPEDLQIHSWGLVVNGTTFTKYFKPGQVLFGKRRAYQRKVAVANFEGVCSGDIYVFEPKDPYILQLEFLPFICQTEGFYEHAVGTSAGSLSPRTNWSQLSNYRFLLPTPDNQLRISRLLSGFEEAILRHKILFQKIYLLQQSYIETATLRLSLPFTKFHWKTAKLGDVADVTKLAGFEFTEHIRYIENGEIIAIRALNIKNNTLDLTDVKRIDRVVSNALPRSKVYSNDILVTYIGEYIGDILRIVENDKYHLAPNVAKITVHEELVPELLEWLLRSINSKQQMKRYTTTTATPSLTMSQIRNIKIHYPSGLEDQNLMVEHIRKIDERKNMVERTVADLIFLKKRILLNTLS